MKMLAVALALMALPAWAEETATDIAGSSDVQGVRDATALIGGWGWAHDPAKLKWRPCWTPPQPRTITYGKGKSFTMAVYPLCNEIDARLWQDAWVRAARERLGDPGRH